LQLDFPLIYFALGVLVLVNKHISRDGCLIAGESRSGEATSREFGLRDHLFDTEYLIAEDF
jgi:hypothetical protein